MNKWTKLGLSLGIDAVGMASIFGAAEPLDLVWAPASALAILALYKDERYAFAGFAEEILPFTDWIPMGTIAWWRTQRKK